jgi:hypothetical protein
VIVNSRPMRPGFVLADLFPALGDRLAHAFGIVDFQRRKVGAAPSRGA